MDKPELIIAAIAELSTLIDETMSSIIDKLQFDEAFAILLNEEIIDDFEPEGEFAEEGPGYYAFWQIGVEDEELVIHRGDRDGNWDIEGTGIPATKENYTKLADEYRAEDEVEWQAYAEVAVATGHDPQAHFTPATTTTERRAVHIRLTEDYRFVSLKVRLDGEDFEFTDRDDDRIPKGLRSYCLLDDPDGPDRWKTVIHESGVSHIIIDGDYIISCHAEWKEPRPTSVIDAETRVNAKTFLDNR